MISADEARQMVEKNKKQKIKDDLRNLDDWFSRKLSRGTENFIWYNDTTYVSCVGVGKPNIESLKLFVIELRSAGYKVSEPNFDRTSLEYSTFSIEF